jgi:hypothetical protein
MSIESKILHTEEEMNIQNLSLGLEQEHDFSGLEVKLSPADRQKILNMFDEEIRKTVSDEMMFDDYIAEHARDIKILFPNIDINAHISREFKEKLISDHVALVELESDSFKQIEILADLKIAYEGKLPLGKDTLETVITKLSAKNKKTMDEKLVIDFYALRALKILSPQVFAELEISPLVWQKSIELMSQRQSEHMINFMGWMACVKIINPDKTPYHLLTVAFLKKWKEVYMKDDKIAGPVRWPNYLSDTAILAAGHVIVNENEFRLVPRPKSLTSPSSPVPEIKKF